MKCSCRSRTETGQVGDGDCPNWLPVPQTIFGICFVYQDLKLARRARSRASSTQDRVTAAVVTYKQPATSITPTKLTCVTTTHTTSYTEADQYFSRPELVEVGMVVASVGGDADGGGVIAVRSLVYEKAVPCLK